jgi:hypothetical protein
MHADPCTGQMNWDWNQAAFWSGAGAALGAAIGAGIYGGLWVGAQLGWWGQTTATTVATAACADGDCTNEIRSTVRLFRAVSETEFQQIMRTGEFETLGSTEGKYFATTLENAKVWGQQLMGEGNFRVVQVDIPAKAVADFYAFPFLDRIGPAYFATMDQLQKLSLTIEEAMQ